jgi:hypothetical protein
VTPSEEAPRVENPRAAAPVVAKGIRWLTKPGPRLEAAQRPRARTRQDAPERLYAHNNLLLRRYLVKRYRVGALFPEPSRVWLLSLSFIFFVGGDSRPWWLVVYPLRARPPRPNAGEQNLDRILDAICDLDIPRGGAIRLLRRGQPWGLWVGEHD